MQRSANSALNRIRYLQSRWAYLCCGHGLCQSGLKYLLRYRFPALYQSLRQQDAVSSLCLPPLPYQRGRPTGKLCFRRAPSRIKCISLPLPKTGQHSTGREIVGHSLCIDPWGKIQGELDHGTGNIQCAINIEKMKQIRHDMPRDSPSKVESLSNIAKIKKILTFLGDILIDKP